MDPVVIYVASDEPNDSFTYRQAFQEAWPTAVLYFFAEKGELLPALEGPVYPDPSLILLDWDMAARKGYQLLQILSRSPAWQHIPVIIIDREKPSVDEKQCLEAGYGLVLPAEKHFDKLVERLRGIVKALAA
ncbi:response regulator [Larkinella soli]|uniref:response regulator n=1 Tax=Larkinella soli TaxID=1770527 RepID=UPI000FFC95C5|nr:response regulator [Larkinella soli]